MSQGMFGPQAANAALVEPPHADTNRYGLNVQTWCKDATSRAANDGTVYDAAFFNRIIGALEAVVAASGVDATVGDATVLLRAIRQMAPNAGHVNVGPGLLGGGSLAGADVTVSINYDYVDSRYLRAIGEGSGITVVGSIVSVNRSVVDTWYVPPTRNIIASGLATGGGTLDTDRTITVPAATNLEALAGTSTTKAMTPASTQAALDQLHTIILGAPPSTLDTLQEIATALGNDPNFATTLTTLIGTKADKSQVITAGSGLTWSGTFGASPGISVDYTVLDARYRLSSVTIAYSSLTGLPTLGGAAALNVGTTTGTVAAGDDSRITGSAQKANNLSDLANAGIARTNLGLATGATTTVGNSATKNVGTTIGTVAAGDDSRIVGAVQSGGSLGTPSSGNLANCTFPTLNQATTANAGTATKLATARLIAGVSFDGSADIAIPYANLTSKPTLGTAAALDVGTTANKIVQLNGTAQLPALDGSLLTGITGAVSSVAGLGGAISASGLRTALNVGQIGAGASSFTMPAAPAGTVSTAVVNAGLGFSFTPTLTGRVMITITGFMNSSVAGAWAFAAIRTGSGSAPANGTSTGSTLNNAVAGISTAANDLVPFSVTGLVTGKTLGTAFWFDLGMATSAIASGANYYSITATIVEV